MTLRLTFLLLTFPVVGLAQTALPPDTDPVTYSRLPALTAADLPVSEDVLDEASQRRLAARPDYRPTPGPTQFQPFIPGDRDLGISSGETSPVGPRLFQLAVLVAAREIDQEYEWASHVPPARRQGLEQSIIDVVKFGRDVAGLDDADATLITFGRTLLREHAVGDQLWQAMLEEFGLQHTMDLLGIMAAYVRVGVILNAIDQQLPPDRDHETLPPLPR